MPAPPHLVFDCRVVTPLFLAGADQEGAELRASSVRGALRYWYRALLGGRGYTDLALAQAESAVFGNAGMGGVQAQAGAVDVVTKLEPGIRVERSKEEIVRNGQRRRVAREDILKLGSGTGYLWYSAALGDNDRGFLPEGTRFQVALVAPRGDAEALKQAGAAFWLLAQLGGLGTRSRSGAGSFWVQSTPRASSDALLAALPPFTTNAADSSALARFLQEGLARTVGLVPSREGAAATKDFDVIAKGKTSVIVSGYTGGCGVDAAREFGADLQRFRSGSTGFKGDQREPWEDRRQEMHAIKRFVHDGTPPRLELKSAGFGLPLQLQFLKHPNGSNWVDPDDPIGPYFNGGTAEIGAPGLTRRASPLQVHVARTSSKYHDVVLTTFNSTFLPNDSRELTLKAGHRQATVLMGRGIISQFRKEVVGAPDKDGNVWMKTVEVPA